MPRKQLAVFVPNWKYQGVDATQNAPVNGATKTLTVNLSLNENYTKILA